MKGKEVKIHHVIQDHGAGSKLVLLAEVTCGTTTQVVSNVLHVAHLDGLGALVKIAETGLDEDGNVIPVVRARIIRKAEFDDTHITGQFLTTVLVNALVIITSIGAVVGGFVRTIVVNGVLVGADVVVVTIVANDDMHGSTRIATDRRHSHLTFNDMLRLVLVEVADVKNGSSESGAGAEARQGSRLTLTCDHTGRQDEVPTGRVENANCRGTLGSFFGVMLCGGKTPRAKRQNRCYSYHFNKLVHIYQLIGLCPYFDLSECINLCWHVVTLFLKVDARPPPWSNT